MKLLYYTNALLLAAIATPCNVAFAVEIQKKFLRNISKAERDKERNLTYMDNEELDPLLSGRGGTYSTRGSNECELGQGVWRNAPEQLDPCTEDRRWKGKNDDKQDCGGDRPRDIKIFIATDNDSEEYDSFFFTTDRGDGVDDSNHFGDQLARPLGMLENNVFYKFEACIDVEDECFFMDFFTRKTRNRDVGFFMSSNGVPMLHMSSSEFNDNDHMKTFKRVSLGQNCPDIERVN